MCSICFPIVSLNDKYFRIIRRTGNLTFFFVRCFVSIRIVLSSDSKSKRHDDKEHIFFLNFESDANDIGVVISFLIFFSFWSFSPFLKEETTGLRSLQIVLILYLKKTRDRMWNVGKKRWREKLISIQLSMKFFVNSNQHELISISWTIVFDVTFDVIIQRRSSFTSLNKYSFFICKSIELGKKSHSDLIWIQINR